MHCPLSTRFTPTFSLLSTLASTPLPTLLLIGISPRLFNLSLPCVCSLKESYLPFVFPFPRSILSYPLLPVNGCSSLLIPPPGFFFLFSDDPSFHFPLLWTFETLPPHPTPFLYHPPCYQRSPPLYRLFNFENIGFFPPFALLLFVIGCGLFVFLCPTTPFSLLSNQLPPFLL